MPPQSSDTVAQALDNLSSIKNGEDPRSTVSNDSSVSPDDIIPKHELDTFHGEPLRDRGVIDDDFVRTVNIVEPDHPCFDDPYPITEDDVEFTYCTHSGGIWARCGPRSLQNVACFAVDRKSVIKMTRERYYNILVHEATHITEGSHTQGSSHNPDYWLEFADNAVTFAKEWHRPIDMVKFVSYCRNNPHSGTTDRRMRTVDEQRQEIEDRMLSRL